MLRSSELVEDARQEAIIRALLGIDRLADAERFGSWLAGIGLNVCRSWIRDQQRRPAGDVELIDAADPDDGPEELTLARDLAWRVHEAITALPPGQRQAVTLFYLEGLDQAASAARLQIPVGALKARLHKGRAALRGPLVSLWEEEHMETAIESQFVEVEVADVWRYPEEADHPGRHRRHSIMLKETGGKERYLYIWVGTFEAEAIVRIIQGVDPFRPLTHDLLASMLASLGARVAEVRVNALREGTFFAEVVTEGPAGSTIVDARPSDAITLALTVSAPIRVSNSIMEAAGMTAADRANRQQGPRPGWLPEGEPEPASRIAEEIRLAATERRRFAEEHGLNQTVKD